MRFARYVALLAVLLWPPLPCTAELPPLIPREVIFDNPGIANPTISPDGSKIAYLAPSGGVLSLRVRSLGSRDEMTVTSGNGRGIHRYYWQHDSRHVLFLQDNDGDENWHIRQVDLETGQRRDLTPTTGVRAEVVALSPRVPGEMLVGINERNRALHDVYRLNLLTGALALDTENPGDVAEWFADNTLRVRLAKAVGADGRTRIRARDHGSPEWRVVLEWASDEAFGSFEGFSSDDRRVYLISSLNHEAGRLVELDLATGATQVVAEDPRYDVYRVLFHPSRFCPQAVQIVRAKHEWLCLDDAVENDLKVLQGLHDGTVNVLGRDQEDLRWIVSVTDDHRPARFYVYDRNDRRSRFLFSDRPALEKCVPARMQPVSFTARDGMRLFGYLTLPPGLEPAMLPLVIRVHGGPWSRHTWGFNEEAQWLANRGYAVLHVDFRGSAGYGKKYLNAGDRQWGAKILTDLLDGKAWAVEHGYADPRRTAIFGASFGGYAVLASLAFTPDEYACGAEFAGPSNLVTLLQSLPTYWTSLLPVFHKRVGHPERDKDLLVSHSPLFKIDRIRSPLLIGHGANDPRVKQSESDQIREALERRQVPVRYMVFDDEGHFLSKPANRYRFYFAVEELFSKYLGGRVEPWREARGQDLE